MDYRTAGVDVVAGRAFVERIRASVESTRRPEVVGGLGGFGGLCRLPEGLKKPLLVSGTDGVGTKLELAQAHGQHHGVGIDLVAMCVNDVITSGAQPLFFLDYIATGKLTPEAMAEVVEGIADGCRQSGCALLGGETAEMPGFYGPGRYDLAGFCVAVVDEDALIDGRAVRAGDRLVAVASSGVHSNGFSLVRRILEAHSVGPDTPLAAGGPPVLEALLTPTRLYGSLVQALLTAGVPLHGMAHITGGGLPENLPRTLPAGVHGRIDATSWERPELFRWLQQKGEVPEADLWNTFNLGVGFCLVVPEAAVAQALAVCDEQGHQAWLLGSVEQGENLDAPLAGLPY
ncbi:phosphoribosylformylglycinamidine cyclo-ligase [Synechococcus sp. HJ21-Hayes]|uniref:phosphoribosylformylglycinamidine cyclo-ligase n=1 Tax=unclassified Synechococcus TaxID=2626047 RepID=UPI0020CD6699|nr:MULTISPECIES: phosphoribosylformylglycinamidine cyclo-ligase [unclassified Synechococcus]MCP9830632.1 phosphoribosylformylglycinamidine cyclo-ligase [Synechococcus sp. JJ3a-Johnson]MCP9851347.1 phosphoribosylformylglycinamidine cyclo-ligase [Synechococcus sp. HJ21-Hayes]